MKQFYYSLLLAIFGCLSLYAQNGGISGAALDAETGEPLIGATVTLEGTTQGTIVGLDGSFLMQNVPPGNHTLAIDYVGYEKYTQGVLVAPDQTTAIGPIDIATSAVGLNEIQVVANVAIDRKTPVAVATIKGDVIENKLGNQEFPEILRTTPSVYTTKSGGGFGDARINVRGFDQRNTAVLINGIPVNDMENGWVYWSNWAGLSDVTKSMQIQRGLGASKLAISSVGGTINIITKTTDQKAGGVASFGVGNDGYLKYGLTLSTGRIGDGWALTFSGSRTTGDGYIDATWIDAYSYFGSITKEIGKKHQLVLTAIGAPQRHGQRSFREGLTKYVPANSTVDALLTQREEMGEEWTAAQTQQLNDAYVAQIQESTTADYDERKEANGETYSARGNIRYNSDWGFKDGERFNIRENFYHKPQFALNHYWNISEKAFLGTSVYYSLGRGGGTGDRGSISAFGGGTAGGTWAFRDDDKLINFDDLVRWNTGTNDIDGFPAEGHYQTDNGYVASEGRRDNDTTLYYNKGLIKRASMNEHNWLGVLSKADIDLGENLNLVAGIDLRQYKGLHYRRAVDLLGNDYWLDSRNVNNNAIDVDTDGNGIIDRRESGALITADDGGFTIADEDKKIHYDNDGIVGWQGVFGELEYSKAALTAFISLAGSNTSYQRVDRFNYETGSENETSDVYNYLGYNAKVGANYNINQFHNVFVNAGYFSRAPIFDDVFPSFNNVDVNVDAENEKIIGLEAGYGLRTSAVALSLNLYRTLWQDKAFFESVQYSDGTDGFANVQGLDAIHQGIELDLKASPVTGLTLRGMASLGDWQWQNDVEGVLFDDNNEPVDTIFVYTDGLKVGDAAQTTLSVGVDYRFKFGLGLDADYMYFDNLYANFDPVTRLNPDNAGKQALKLPSYGLLNAGLSYKFDLNKAYVKLRINGNNLLDELYVAEANDGEFLTDAGGFFGFGRTWSASLRVGF